MLHCGPPGFCVFLAKGSEDRVHQDSELREGREWSVHCQRSAVTQSRDVEKESSSGLGDGLSGWGGGRKFFNVSWREDKAVLSHVGRVEALID